MSLEKFREKEKLYALYGISTSSISSLINECIEDLITNAIEDSKKKLKLKNTNIDPSEIDGTLEKMKNNYLLSAKKWSGHVDEWVEKKYKLPENSNEQDSTPSEVALDQIIEARKHKLFSIKMFREELAGIENELTNGESAKTVLDELHTVKASAMQVKSELINIRDLFSSKALNTNDLDKSIRNMSIG